jgi:UrcA family protein
VGDGLVISTAGLDLTAQRDREALLVRLETSAARLCRDVHPRVERLACEADAVARAVASAPKLAEAIEKAKAERRPSRLAALSGAN